MKRVLFSISFLFILITVFLFVMPTKALALPILLDAKDFKQEQFLQTSLSYMANGVVCALIDQNYTKPDRKGCLTMNQSGQWQKSDGTTLGAVGALSNLTASLYTPPASGVYYFADLGRNLGIVKPAYAQGTGFTVLGGLLPLWKAFRNLAYVIFVLVFIVIGFAVMFRVKLDPKTVVTIESVIPKLVLTLILITFSYAIAGLLVDLVYVIIGIGSFTLFPFATSMSITPDLAGQQEKMMRLGFFDLVGMITSGLVKGTLTMSAFFTAPAALIALILTALTATAPVAVPIVNLALLVIVLIFLLILIYVMFKLFLALLQCYVAVVLYTIFGPLLIAAGAIPGVPGFSSWIKNLAANIMVFPVVALYFELAWVFTSKAASITWTPPAFGFPGPAGSVSALIGVGMILLSPKVPDIVKDAFGIKPFRYGTAIGEALEFGTRPASFIRKSTEGAVGSFVGSKLPADIQRFWPGGVRNIQPPE